MKRYPSATVGVEDGARTRDTRNHNPMLYRLSYIHHRKSDPIGAPDRNRTCNRRLRRPMLYPVELRAQRSVSRPRGTPSPRVHDRSRKLVGVEGFEPTTSSSQSWRATRLRYTPRSFRGTTPANRHDTTSTLNGQTAGHSLHLKHQRPKPVRASIETVARPEGFEPPTTWFVARYSIQLSYGRVEQAVCRADWLSSTPLAQFGCRICASNSARAACNSTCSPSSAAATQASRSPCPGESQAITAKRWRCSAAARAWSR